MSALSQDIVDILKLEFDERLAQSIFELSSNKIGKKTEEIRKEDLSSLIPLLGEAILLYGSHENLSDIFNHFSELTKK